MISCFLISNLGTGLIPKLFKSEGLLDLTKHTNTQGKPLGLDKHNCNDFHGSIYPLSLARPSPESHRSEQSLLLSLTNLRSVQMHSPGAQKLHLWHRNFEFLTSFDVAVHCVVTHVQQTTWAASTMSRRVISAMSADTLIVGVAGFG